MRYTLSLFVVLFVALSACPVKLALRTVSDQPVQNENTAGHKVNLYSGLSASSTCTHCISRDTNLRQQTSSQKVRLFPLLSFANMVFSLQPPTSFSLSSFKESKNKEPSGSLPVFIRHGVFLI